MIHVLLLHNANPASFPYSSYLLCIQNQGGYSAAPATELLAWLYWLNCMRFTSILCRTAVKASQSPLVGHPVKCPLDDPSACWLSMTYHFAGQATDLRTAQRRQGQHTAGAGPTCIGAAQTGTFRTSLVSNQREYQKVSQMHVKLWDIMHLDMRQSCM